MRGRSSISTVWGQFSEVDSTVTMRPKHLGLLHRKRVYATRYKRDVFFRNMSAGRISLFQNYPVPLRASVVNTREDLPAAISKVYGQKNQVRFRQGPSDTIKYRPVDYIVKLWERQRAVLGLTDLHIRRSPAERVIDPKILSQFNLLCEGTQEVQQQEMMTVVISSANNLTDSHSDDPDGSNHCFLGEKLWLAWDTFEGLENGLEDVERVPYGVDRASFDLDIFLKLKSSKWFLIREGETLFLPGHYTHKVFTLKPYIGVGSFYVSIPNSLRTLTRWKLDTPLWELAETSGINENLVPSIAKTVLKKLIKLKHAPVHEQRTWGYDYRTIAWLAWKRRYNAAVRDTLFADPIFADLAAEFIS